VTACPGCWPGACGPSEEEVREELSTLLSRAEFHTSERNRRFLSHIVKETLQGRADRIKAYGIAIAAFDRSDDFDPLTDPIVWIEAGRLRRSLEIYYLTAGKADRVRIDMPACRIRTDAARSTSWPT
jgi:adenylate cyclase